MKESYNSTYSAIIPIKRVSGTIWHKNVIVIKFYGLPLNHLYKKLTDFNFMEVQFRVRCCGTIQFMNFNFMVLSLIVKL